MVGRFLEVAVEQGIPIPRDGDAPSLQGFSGLLLGDGRELRSMMPWLESERKVAPNDR